MTLFINVKDYIITPKRKNRLCLIAYMIEMDSPRHGGDRRVMKMRSYVYNLSRGIRAYSCSETSNTIEL